MLGEGRWYCMRSWGGGSEMRGGVWEGTFRACVRCNKFYTVLRRAEQQSEQ